ncbi:pyridoxal-phosphate dependent enzyme family protein [hydrothermal vent metagenome]|uniref:Pyridoxal-phosphate dependent enzyme family protein n=1 Tax=hydrothermal vent metagenome TaxID=652676 RepID=A0A3B0RES2_9ZZZZ
MSDQTPNKELLDPTRKPSFAGVARAAEKIARILPKTPLLPLEIDGKIIWCKAECLQPVGAFKIRGGWHRLSDLSADERKKGVVAFSSGNHAQGVAWAAKRLDIAATIIMPGDAPRAKMRNTEALGAKIVTYERMSGAREQLAADIAAETGATVVPSFDDPWVVEGQGSCGIEIRDQMIAQTGAPPGQLVICCGGGGLAAGSALANPEAEIIVVEPEGWDDMRRSLECGYIVPVVDNPPATNCDALQTMKVAPITYDILKERKTRGVSVTETEVHHAVKIAFEKLHIVAEPGGAVALAAILAGKIAPTANTALTISGGNIDSALFAEIITA